MSWFSAYPFAMQRAVWATVSTNNRLSNGRAAWTIFELFALIFMIYFPVLIGNLVAKNYGVGAGTGAGILSAAICVTSVFLSYRAHGRRYEERRRELRENYRGIYRVIVLPTDTNNTRKPQGAEIKVGDYGWEAQPFREDGLIYLQGLSAEWRVVWYAGFRSDQIERVGPKPQSQYDWNYSWERTPPPCPFPVQARDTPDMGLPVVRTKTES
jgi:hypothetical protein